MAAASLVGRCENQAPSEGRRVIRLYVGLQLFFNLLLWIPIFYEFQRQIGLSDPEIFRIQSVYYLLFCLFEVPTGWLADRLGYRHCLILGSATLVGANLLPILTPSYGGMMTHFVAIALARSLLSGASSAYIYEWLRGRGETSLYKQVEGDARFWSLVARVVCWTAVGYLMARNIFLPYWLSAACVAMALAAACLLPKVTPDVATATPPSKASPGGSFTLAWQAVKSSPLILVLMFQGVGIFVLARILQVNLYQPILKDKAFDIESFGAIMAGMTVFEALGSKLTPFLRGRISDSMAVFAVSLVVSACLVVIAAGAASSTLLGFGVFSLVVGYVFPVQKQLINDAITDGKARATLLSIESILDRAVCAVAVLPLGGLVSDGKLSETLIVCGAITAATSIVVQLLVVRLRKLQHGKLEVSI